MPTALEKIKDVFICNTRLTRKSLILTEMRAKSFFLMSLDQCYQKSKQVGAGTSSLCVVGVSLPV
jgi:hypothetical protein